ncbi:MAG: UbiD family decarboxylase [Planctomycetota bacterium]
MGYRNTRECIDDLLRHQRLIRIETEIDAHLEAAEIQRRVYLSGGPALEFANVKNCAFPMASNLFGTIDRARFIFRDSFENVKRAIQLKVDPSAALKSPFKYWKAPLIAWRMQPKRVSRGSVIQNETRLSALPQLKSWPDDGGAFVTLPQVYSEHPDDMRPANSNMGMYRVQYSGNEYAIDQEVGIHYQIHRGIGVHHRAAIDSNQPFRVNVFVGGSPAMSVAAVMPLPEGMSELTFAGALAGHRIPMIRQSQASSIYGDADFCIVGTIDPERQLPEGPFGDHLGYYSLQHNFPVLNVEKVYHRDGAVWPFTVVGRPPQEDTVFGELIHELTGPVIPTVLPGVKAVNAVDAAGVHPLLLAIGSERYVPYRATTQPQELLTQANAILGQGQMSLAKYLWIIDEACCADLKVDDIESFFARTLERTDWTRDLHFQTRTTIDTLDYSGSGFNEGSKVVIAAAGPQIRSLPTAIPADLHLPDSFRNPELCLRGVIAVEGPSFDRDRDDIERFVSHFHATSSICQFPLVVIVDDSNFTSRTLNNFLWTVFTRSDPATDIHGIDASTIDKHWGCGGSLIIDARIKPRHAPPLIEDPKVTKKVDALAAKGGALGKYL